MNATVSISPDESGAGWSTAIRFALLSIVAAGLLFPASAVLIGGTLFPYQAQGSLIEVDGRVVGSALVAQPFAADKYFRVRPSAVNYDPRAVGGSNWAPSNPALRERIEAASSAIAAGEGVAATSIPSDLVTASGSGIDPHISVEAAALQVARVAQARGFDTARVQTLVDAHTLGKTWGVLGQARVNVLQLNLALDAL